MRVRIIAALLITIAATTASPQAARQRSSADWKIEIATRGGFTGGGSGGLIISSDGTLVVTFGNSRRCSFQLSAADLQALDEAVRNARPQSWMECYSLANIRTHCCDLIRTSLTLTSRSGADMYATSWITGSTLPRDLDAIDDLLHGPGSLDARYRPLCVTP